MLLIKAQSFYVRIITYLYFKTDFNQRKAKMMCELQERLISIPFIFFGFCIVNFKYYFSSSLKGVKFSYTVLFIHKELMAYCIVFKEM